MMNTEMWWPAQFGSPSTSGKVGNWGYAYFPTISRLAVKSQDEVVVYDTGDHHFRGAWRELPERGLSFQSQRGLVPLADLVKIG